MACLRLLFAVQALSCLVRVLRALVEWYIQTAPHATADIEPATTDKQLGGQKESWGQLQSLKRAQSDLKGARDQPGKDLPGMSFPCLSKQVLNKPLWLLRPRA